MSLLRYYMALHKQSKTYLERLYNFFGNMDDSSGNNQTGSATGTGVSWVTDKDGIANNSLQVINSGNTVNMPTVHFSAYNGGFTFSTLVYDLGVSYDNPRHLLYGNTSTEGYDIQIYLGEVNTLDPYLYVRICDIADTTNSNYLQAKTPYLGFNIWRSIVVKYDGSANASGITVSFDGISQTPVYSTVGTFTKIKNNTPITGSTTLSTTHSIINLKLQRYSIWSKILNTLDLTSLLKPYLLTPVISHTGYVYGSTTTISANVNYAFTPNFKFYTAKTGGTLLGTGSSYTTDALTSPTTIWVCSEYNGNESARIPVALYPVDSSYSDADMILIADAENTGVSTEWHNLAKTILSEQPIAVGTPTVVANQINGNAVMRFNGSTDYFNAGKNILQVGDKSLSLFIVKKINVGTNGIMLGKFILGASPDRYWITHYLGNLYANYNSNSSISASKTQGMYELISIIWDIVNNTNKLYVNGTLVASGTITGHYFNTYDLLIGAGCDATGNVPPASGTYFNGDMATVVAFHSAVNDTKRISIETYLRHKYGFLLFTVDKDVTLSGGLRGIAIVESDNIYLLSKYDSNTVEIRNLTTDVLIGSALTGFSNPAGIALDIANDRYYVACVGSNLVRVMQYSTHTQITTITGISACSGLVLDVPNDRIYVSGYNETVIKIFKHSDYSYVGTLGSGLSFPAMPDIYDGKLYCPDGGTSTYRIYDILTNTLLKTLDSGQSLTGQILIDVSNGIYYVGSYASNPVVCDLNDDSEIAILSSASRGVGLCLRPATNSVYFARYSVDHLTTYIRS